SEPNVPGEDVLHAFFGEQTERLLESEQDIRVRRVWSHPVLAGSEHLRPVPHRLRQGGVLVCSKGFVTDGVEGQSWREHEALLRTGDRDIDPPFIVTIID